MALAHNVTGSMTLFNFSYNLNLSIFKLQTMQQLWSVLREEALPDPANTCGLMAAAMSRRQRRVEIFMLRPKALE